MAEQTQTDFFSGFESVDSTTPISTSTIKSIDTKTLEDEKQIIPQEQEAKSDFFSGFESVDSEQEVKSDFFSGFESVDSEQKINIPKETPLTYTTEEPSWFRKFTYGFDKQDQFFGNVFRIGKGLFQDIKDDNRDLQDVLKDNAGIENQRLLNKFQKFKNKKYDDDIYVKAGEVASMLLDPFYLMAYLTPWGRAASASYKGIATIGGATVGLDTLVSEFAKTGEFKPKEAAIAGASAAALGPAAMKTFRVISKYFPGADKKKIAQIVDFADKKKRKQLGLNKKEYNEVSKIVGDKEFITLNNLIDKTGKNLSDVFEKPQFAFDKKTKTLNNSISKIKKLNKEKFTKANQNKINKLEDNKRKILDEFKKDRKELVKKQSALLQKENELISKRDVKILEKLRQNESLTDTTIRYVLSASTRPLFGAGVGYAFGTLWGAEDDELNRWIYGGALLGTIQKGIKASKVLTVGDKTKATNILNNEAVKLTLQKLRVYTATTTATKLKAFGGKTEQLGNMLLQNLDSPYSKNSISKVADEIRSTWTTRAVNIFKPYSEIQGTNALNSLRGSTIKLTAKEKILKRNIKNYLNDFQNLYTKAGIFGKENIKDYFPRVYNFDRIQKNPKKFEETLIQIFKNKGAKNPVKEAKKFQDNINDVSNFNIVKTNIDDLINDKKISNQYIITPLSNHINQQRKLTGTFTQVEKLLSDNGFLINNPSQVLSSLVNRSANSIAFSQRLGPNGQYLAPFYQSIKDKYKNTGKTNWRQLAQKEIQVINNTIEAYFDRFGHARRNELKATAGVLSTISNLNMLDRVTIASLGDLVQPFTNSNNWLTWLKALSRTALTAKRETGVAKNLGIAHNNEIRASLQKPLAIKGDEISANASWLGNDKLSLTAANNLFFRISGLEWLTGFARRFAYNAGAIDAYTTANKLSKFVSKGGRLNSSKGSKLITDLERYGITATDALKIGSKSYDDIVKTAIGKKNLNEAGIAAANRDAIIPQVSNRLLFTQSNAPWVRLMGQFLSWSMAKSAQTNKILSRIENGDVRTMVKLVAALPVYGGIQELRELAKYGEVVTDINTDADEWWSEAIRLSGLPGVGPEFVASNLVGPGSRQPFFLAFPAGSILYESDKILKDYFKGNTERANERFFQRIAPLPNWRNFILERAKDLGVDFDDGGRKLPESKLERKTFNEGDEVTSDMNLKKVATGMIAAKIATSGVNADMLKTSILPKKKPEAANYMPIIKKYESLGKKIIVDGVEKYKNYQGQGEENITSGYGSYRAENKLEDSVTEGEANAQLVEDINERLPKVKENIKNFDKFPLDVKQHLVSSWFRGSLSGSPLTLDLINAGEYEKAAEEFLRNDEYDNAISLNRKGIKKRMENTAKAIKSLSKEKFNLGGIVGKAIVKGLSKAAVKRGDTAISTTVGTYKKVNKIFDDANVKTVHDFGSGLGLGSKEFTNKIVTNHEPFVPVEKIIKVKGKVPDYKTADDVIFKEGFASKDGVVNANVLNVIEDPIERANVVRQISQLISNKGMAVITTRGNEVTKAAQASKNATPFNDGWIFGKGDKKTFQKGYSQKELEEYIKSILGDKFKVEKIPSKYKIGTSGVIIKKIKGDK